MSGGEFEPGQAVFVTRARKQGLVVSRDRLGCYTVLIGSLRMHCRGEDLQPSKHSAPCGGTSVQVASPRRKAEPSIDLHGLTVQEALDRVEERVNDCVLAGTEKLEVIHGIGSGKIREALHRRLSALRVVKRFQLDEQNRGTTWVYF